MILLTGATGLLGSHIAYELLQQGKKIRALKRKDSNSTLTEKYLAFILTSKLNCSTQLNGWKVMF